MSWRETLRAATFRGVPFEVESVDLSAGRRVVVHEYPQRDDPYPEDMGRAAREMTFSAFVIGENYMLAHDALLAAVEKAGAGELIHPFYGTLQVVITRCRVAQSRDEGGMARFDLAFVEAGKLVFPSSSIATGQKIESASANVMSKLSGLFTSRYSLKNLPDWARRVAGDDVSNVLSEARGLVAQADTGGSWLAQFDEKASVASTQTNNSMALASTVSAALTPPETSTVAKIGSKGDALGPITRWAASYNAALASPVVSSAVDPVSTQAAQNAAALRDLVRGGFLTQGAFAASQTDVTVYQDAMNARAALTRAIDAEMSLSASDDVYQAWADLRSALHTDLTLRAKNAARLKTMTPGETTPAVALAYDLYENAGRDDEIVTRNAIRHPGFVPAEPLLVLNT